MAIIIFSFLAAASGALFTGIGCKICHRRPGWHFFLLGTVITVLITLLVIGGSDLFHPERWDQYKGGFWPLVIFPSEAAAVIALMPSLVVVYYFRAKFKNDKPVKVLEK
jgi:hypothetical protein